ncbi:MAG: hypothetical protein E7299_02935 [Lachnospiraceae bacterium]|nr:hypothetical protein [Lachnospiraceae bacterium]
MKGLFAKFATLSMTWKIATVAVACAVLSVATAATVIVSSQKEAKEAVDSEVIAEVATVDEDVAVNESSEEETQEKHVISADSERINELKDNLFAKEEKKDKETIETTKTEANADENVPSASTINNGTPSNTENAQSANVGGQSAQNGVKGKVPAGTDAYYPPDAGQTYTYPGDDKIGSYTVTIPEKYDMPYIVNGIDIRDGDIDGDGVTDNSLNTWYKGQYFVGSNGVKVRIADAYRVDAERMVPHPDAIFRDGTENIEPTSEWQKAVVEYLADSSRLVSPSSLPWVSTVSSKQTTIDKNNPSFVAYKDAFDILWHEQNRGGFSYLQPIDNNQDGVCDGIGLLDNASGKLGYMWEMKYDSGNGYWKLEIKGNYTELIWNSIHNSIRMITPDADAVYNAIYELYYYGGDWVADYDGWYPIPNANSEILVHLEGNSIYYCFR